MPHLMIQNPPADGGFKYNPPEGGPADTDITDWIQARANSLLSSTTEAPGFAMAKGPSNVEIVDYH